MRFIFTILILVLAVLAAIHAFFYVTTGTIEPCHAAVLRIIQKHTRGNDALAKLGEVFQQQGEDLLRREGIAACYRSALTGDAPEQLTVKFNLPR
jgi:hypothetical protein